MLAKQKFPALYLTQYKLRKLYKKYKIKKKMIRVSKLINRKSLIYQTEEKIDLHDDLNSAIIQGFRII